MRYIILIAIASLVFCKVSAQIIKPLQIGDIVPDIQFQMMNYIDEHANLSDFRGKLVILDFWATWCGPCIKEFPKMDSLQQLFQGKLKVILVNSTNTGDSISNIKSFLNRWQKQHNSTLSLPIAFNDTAASLYFPHHNVPHYVWISPDGKLVAQTWAKVVTAENIKKILADASLELPFKRDFDPLKPLIFGEDLKINDSTAYTILKKGELPGLNATIISRKINRIFRGFAARNVSLSDLYRRAIVNIDGNSDFNYHTKRMILELSEPVKKSFTNAEAQNNGFYTYDRVVIPSETDRISGYMIQDLNYFAGLHSRFEDRFTKCLVLVTIGNGSKLKSSKVSVFKDSSTDKKLSMYYTSISKVATWIDRLNEVELPVLDKTGYIGKIDIELDFGVENINLESIREKLRPFGLDLKEEFHKINVFVITERSYTN